MEKCEMSLRNWITQNKNQKVKRGEFLKFALSILYAIEYLHMHDFILRDLSLKNILIDKNGQIKLCDFGLIKDLKANKNSSIKGAAYYLPPEIINNQNGIDNSSEQEKVQQNKQGDIWAFGICLYELAGAQFKDQNRLVYGDKKYTNQTLVDEDINEIIKNILIHDQSKRPSVKQLIEIFKNLSSNLNESNNDFDSIINQINNLSLDCSSSLASQILDSQSSNIDANNNNNSNSQLFSSKLTIEMNYLEYYELQVKRDPQNETALYQLGLVYIYLEMYEQAITFLLHLLQLNPKSYNGNKKIALVYNRLKQYQQAAHHCIQAININPQDYQAYYELAYTFYFQENYPETITYLLEAIKHNQQSEELYYCLGFVYYQSQEFEQIELNPNNELACKQLAYVFNIFQRYEEAKYYCQRVIQINPNNHQIFQQLGLV